MTSKVGTYEPTETLNVGGLSCPIPVVRIRGAVDELESSEILQVIAADSSNVSGLKSQADATGDAAILDQEEAEENGDAVFRRSIQKE